MSSSEWVIFTAVLLSAFATFLTRAAPFYVIKNYKPRPWLTAVERHMVLMIMVILVCYGLKDIKFDVYPYGLNEALAVFSAVLIHLRFKNALLSIAASTAIYMTLIRII